MQGPALERYVSDFNQEDLYQSRLLWKQYAGRTDLIDFTQGKPRQYVYDPRTLTYMQSVNGRTRKIPMESVKMDVNRFANGIMLAQRQNAADMMNAVITPQQWYDQTARTMKLSYRAAVDVARGQNGEMDDSERNKWLLLILILFLLLNDTAGELENGNILLDGRFPIHQGLRGAAVRSIFENWHLWQAQGYGYREAKRLLSPVEHCEETVLHPGCLEEANKGWMPIEKMVPIGGCTCLNNCKCRIIYRNHQSPIF